MCGAVRQKAVIGVAAAAALCAFLKPVPKTRLRSNPASTAAQPLSPDTAPTPTMGAVILPMSYAGGSLVPYICWLQVSWNGLPTLLQLVP